MDVSGLLYPFSSSCGRVTLHLPSDWVLEPTQSGVIVYPDGRPGTLWLDVIVFEVPASACPLESSGEEVSPGLWLSETCSSSSEEGVPLSVTTWEALKMFPGLAVVPVLTWAIEVQFEPLGHSDLEVLRDAVRKMAVTSEPAP